MRELIEVRAGDGTSTFFTGPCHHEEVVPVESVENMVVAHLCLECDAQLPDTWRS